MKKALSLFPLCIVLAGCPGGYPAPHTRATFINGDYLCFSVNKEDILDYYTIYSSEGMDINIVTSSEGINMNVSYPDTCIDIKWKYGYSYAVSYGLNGKKYAHEFFIDNNGQLTNLGGL